jgi:hypothetical protein
VDALVHLDEAIAHQRAKLMAVASRLNPRLTPEDVLSPADFPELAQDPLFNYEEGLLAGLISARALLHARP